MEIAWRYKWNHPATNDSPMPRLPCASSTILQGQHDLDESDIGNLRSPYILVFKDPLLTYLLVSVPSIFTLRYQVPNTFSGRAKEVGNITCIYTRCQGDIFWRNTQRVTSNFMNKKDLLFSQTWLSSDSATCLSLQTTFKIYYARIVVVCIHL